MNIIEKATIRRYHQDRLHRFGAGAVEALGWKGEKSQRKRFDVIAEVINPSGCTLLDIGCGVGDLKAYLDERFGPFYYTGVDQMPEFIADAKRRYAYHENAYFFETDFSKIDLPKVDFITASGALGYRVDDETFYFEMIAKMYLAAEKTVVFNMLETSAFEDHPLLKGHDRSRIESFCRKLCRNVTVVSGYLPDDFTVVMSRRGQCPPEKGD
jgi:trans-aconitate methyltransferase